jgi:Ca2+-binding RTX toxin-like protein
LFGGTSADRLFGDDGADQIGGGDGDDLAYGGNGDDTFFGDTGADFHDGGDGLDLVDYRTALAGITIDLLRPGENTGFALGDTFQSIEIIIGTYYGDVFNGSEIADRFQGDRGNDMLDGRAGIDVVQFRRPLNSYIIEFGIVAKVVDKTQSRDGVDTLTSIERLRFTDGVLALDITLPGQGESNAGSAYRLYEAAFNRTPDNPGLAFWIKAIDGGVTPVQAAQGFVNSDEFRQVYGANPTAQQLVTGFYTNILGRAPEQAGFNFWFNILNNRPDQRAVVLEGIANSPENQNGLIATIGQGIWLPGDLLA